MNQLVKIVLALLAASALVEARFNKQAVEKELLDAMLAPDKYDSSIRPVGKNGSGPVEVTVNLYIRSISDINTVKMDYSVQLTFRQEWIDERLTYDDQRLNYLTLTRSDKLWKPDLFFSNERNGHFHNMLMPNELIRISSNGHVLYSTRISMKLSCPMDLRNYPLDIQKCEIIMASYGYTSDDIVFVWKQQNPVQITKRLNLPSFTLTNSLTAYCTSKTNTGEYSCVRVELHFSRETTYHIIQSYISTTAFVLLSWLTFWLDRRSIVTRIAIALSALLAIVLRATTISASSPAVSYTKAIDVWIGMCMSFIFCVVIELCLVNNAVAAEDQQRLINQLVAEEAKADKHGLCIDDHGKQNQLRTFTFTPLRWLNKIPSKAQRIDAVSRYLFPASFVLFNFVYWLSYLPQRS